MNPELVSITCRAHGGTAPAGPCCPSCNAQAQVGGALARERRRDLAETVCCLFIDPSEGPSSVRLHDRLRAWRELDGVFSETT